jgi:ribonuclease G
VLVTIVEPHMYNVDDAVAKVDGYIISVADGGAHVGEKRLVRIEEAGRTSATAVLVDDAPGSANGAKAKPKPAARKPSRAKAQPKGDSSPDSEDAAPDDAAPADDAAASDEDAVESKPRRRSRRGGRRRSAAKAEATSD